MENIFWVDLEMTGLDPDESVIIEFAGIVTDLKLTPLANYHQVVFQPPERMTGMNDWVRTTHSASGLLDLVPQGIPLAQVDAEIVAFLKPFFPKERPVLAGNSIHQDRKFIDRYMPGLSHTLHYRMIDVSSFKQIFRHMYHIQHEKHAPHRALDDIQASIDELKYYLQYIKLPLEPTP